MSANGSGAATATPPRLTGHRVAILLESDYVEHEISYYQHRFAEEGAEVVLLSRLWGQDSLTFTGQEYRAQITVTDDLESFTYDELNHLSALLTPSGMVADRLRFTEDIERPAPALDLMRRAFRLPKLVKAFSCHGLMLVAAAPELVNGRAVTCHNNLVGDVRNMGAIYVNQDIVVDGDLITGRTVNHCHLLARTVIDALDPPTVPAAPATPTADAPLPGGVTRAG
ncbi:DJ-1/PfpI family protein [Streptomyces triticirhizae]|uniref:Thiamine biosynthesis protein ThiJ n=1 Tax=Streptomyces triticirhizae TaxID=2483353 RepID=A0A3M2KRI7_9ACTN|nr:DJ-1/PfpI family protein [Streptomyces triticirhizae]RMI27634.1 thiamine biosynthesis protein ThiJ [Streptomyces triticirhizae]